MLVRTVHRNHYSLERHLRSFSTHVYTWGSGNEGQLGHSSIEKAGIRNAYEELVPKRVDFFNNIAVEKLVFGASHSLAVGNDGRVYAWGQNDYNKLGLGSTDTIVQNPTIVEALKDVHIVDAACGNFHSLALDKSGQVYSWGWGGSFMAGVSGLGHGDSKAQKMPKQIDTFQNECVHIAQVETGELHSLALTDDGELWGWGNGEYGRMGNGGTDSFYVPEVLEYFEELNCIQIAAGEGFSLALTDDGRVHCWGKNDYGQLGLGGSIAMDVYNMENYPKEIESLQGVKITSIAAGATHSAAIGEDGQLYVWGMKLWLEPHEMVVLKDQRIVDVACGMNFTVAVSDKGEVYTFGKGRTSCLGHADRKTQNQPALVESLAGVNVKSVSCGHRHVGIIAECNAAMDRDFSLRH